MSAEFPRLPDDQPNILTEAESGPEVLEVDLGTYPGFISQAALQELKHSIRMHLILMAGPSQQLCSFLIKTIDFFEDSDEARRDREMLSLSFHIIEGLALFVQQSVDERADKAKAMNQEFPQRIRLASDNILVMVGKSRNLDDRVAAKYAVLRTVADALRELATFTKAVYPQIIDASGNVL